MSRWFVYLHDAYHPSGEVVEAETAEAALTIAEVSPGDVLAPGSAVFPCDAVAYLVEEWPS